mmetsp:Transcript_24708/g.53736  ORF Transcript_24708/g.53736 Transcript_24708/m.53736 type:complete len:301 (+) Transcript_24708:367-1269(+)
MAKKSLLTGKDHVTRWFFGISALLGLICLVPVIPWRYAKMTPVFHSRFSTYRQTSLLMMTDKSMSWKAFTKWKRTMCQLQKSYATPDLLSSLASAATTVVAQKTGFSPATAMGCKLWSPCKDHVTVRCTGYQTLVILGFAVMACILISAVCSLAVVCLVASDVSIKASNKKKKAKKEAAMFNTMIAAIVAFVLSSGGLCAYMFAGASVFAGFQDSSYYPFQAAYIGCYICGTMVGFQFVGMFFAIYRIYGPKPSTSKDDDEDDNNMMMMGGGGGMPPPMMGGPMMGPPMMSGPPMGQRAF